jgi:uncharacterized RDD family membrane protein YckC
LFATTYCGNIDLPNDILNPMKFYRIIPKPYIKLRILATLIDYGLFFIFFYVYIICVGEKTEDGRWVVNGLPTLPIVVVWFLYFVITEAVNQATPGHDICKLKVFKPDGRKLTISDAFKRRICDPIDIMLYGIPALICISKTEKHQRLGDLLANTLVAKTSDITETEVQF